jgi:hypothetical protein
MSSETAAPEETLGSSENPSEGMESSEYEKEEAVETGRLPESEGFESERSPAVEIGGMLYREGIDTGP